MRIVETDNHGGDYPDESFLALHIPDQQGAEEICALINKYCSGDGAPRYWKVVENDYQLSPTFEP